MDTEHDIELLVHGFETCTVPRSHWTHEAHLTVALYYVRRYPLSVAIERMRDGLHRLLDELIGDTSAYHETITVAWMHLIAAFVAEADRGQPFSELALELHRRSGDKDALFTYYSRERLLSDEARRTFATPDKRPLSSPAVLSAGRPEMSSSPT